MYAQRLHSYLVVVLTILVHTQCICNTLGGEDDSEEDDSEEDDNDYSEDDSEYGEDDEDSDLEESETEVEKDMIRKIYSRSLEDYGTEGTSFTGIPLARSVPPSLLDEDEDDGDDYSDEDDSESSEYDDSEEEEESDSEDSEGEQENRQRRSNTATKVI